MRSAHYKHYTLSDLEWLVLPPLQLRQFRIAEASTHAGGPRLPVAVALWASVSADTDRRLSEGLDAAMRLRPAEWRSGDFLWLVHAAGDGRALASLLKKLSGDVWKGRKVETLKAEGGMARVVCLPDMLKSATDQCGRC